VFLRLKSCNILCGGQGTVRDKQLHDGATWRCDTIEVWLQGSKKEFPDVLSDELVERLRAGARLIITGGEPLLQTEEIGRYVAWLKRKVWDLVVEVETNGTIVPDNYLTCFIVNQWNCSPKLSNSGVSREKRFIPEALIKLNSRDRTIFKFVVTSESDWEEIKTDFLPLIDKKKIWLMPGASSIGELLNRNKLVSSIALREGVNFSSRLQVEIWNQTTGV
jgi:organic radical activating enzyme